jgi:hypothetical protein
LLLLLLLLLDVLHCGGTGTLHHLCGLASPVVYGAETGRCLKETG